MMNVNLPTPSWPMGFAHNQSEALNENLRDGLVVGCQMGLGPTGGTLYDLSGRGNDGVLTNMDSSDWNVGEKGWGLDFDNTAPGDYVNIPHNSDFSPGTGDFSVGILMSKNSTSSGFSNFWAFAKWGSGGSDDYAWSLHLTATGEDDRPRFGIRLVGTSVAVQSTSLMSLNKMTYLIGLRRSDNLEIWVDGILTGTAGSASGNIPDSAALDPRIGASNHTVSNQRLDGSVALAHYHNRALLPQEIQHLYVDRFALVREKALIVPFAPLVGVGHVGPLVDGPILKSKVGGGLVAA